MSRTITIEGEEITIPSLKRKQLKQHLAKFGYKPSFYEPPRIDGTDELDRDLMDQGYEEVLRLALGEEMIERLDLLGGNGALNKAYRAIVAETYGSKGEEKNL